MPNKKPPTKAATITKKPLTKAGVMIKKPPTKTITISKKPPTQAMTIANNAPAKAPTIAQNQYNKEVEIFKNQHAKAIATVKNQHAKAVKMVKNQPPKTIQLAPNQSLRQIVPEVLLLFNVYVKEALIKALDQDNALIFIEDEDVIKVHAFTDRPAHFQFVLPDLRSLIRIPGLIDPTNPANLIASFERKDKLRDITLELIGATYNEEKELSILRVRRVPGAETFDSVKLEIGEKVKVKDLRLCIDDVPAGQEISVSQASGEPDEIVVESTVVFFNDLTATVQITSGFAQIVTLQPGQRSQPFTHCDLIDLGAVLVHLLGSIPIFIIEIALPSGRFGSFLIGFADTTC